MRVRFESFTALKYGTWFWMNTIQDRTQSWRSLLFKVFHCVCHIFSCIFWQKKFTKTGKKNKQAKKFKPWILLNQKRTEKQMRAAALRHRIFFSVTGRYPKIPYISFLSLISTMEYTITHMKPWNHTLNISLSTFIIFWMHTQAHSLPEFI